MSTHISAKSSEIAQTVIMPGDPLRAKYMAETFLQDVVCYNEIRGTFGYTGYYDSQKVSIQSSGMGIPSFLIYAHELITSYNVKQIIRIGTAGALTESVHVSDIVLAMSASTTSSINRTRFRGYDFAPTADFQMLMKAYEIGQDMNLGSKIHVGPILTSDEFYSHDEGLQLSYGAYGVLAVEMETAGLYTVASQFGVRALSVLTISDHLLSHEELTALEREQSTHEMMNIALGLSKYAEQL